MTQIEKDGNDFELVCSLLQNHKTLLVQGTSQAIVSFTRREYSQHIKVVSDALPQVEVPEYTETFLQQETGTLIFSLIVKSDGKHTQRVGDASRHAQFAEPV